MAWPRRPCRGPWRSGLIEALAFVVWASRARRATRPNQETVTRPPPDVLDWRHAGNRLHPTPKRVGILKPPIDAFSKPGNTVLDPFCGSGSTLAAAQELERRFIGIELDPAHHRHGYRPFTETPRAAAALSSWI